MIELGDRETTQQQEKDKATTSAALPVSIRTSPASGVSGE